MLKIVRKADRTHTNNPVRSASKRSKNVIGLIKAYFEKDKLAVQILDLRRDKRFHSSWGAKIITPSRVELFIIPRVDLDGIIVYTMENKKISLGFSASINNFQKEMDRVLSEISFIIFP